MSTYYAYYDKELARVGMQSGEIAIYTGVIPDGLRDGPSTCGDSRNAYVYWKDEEGVQGLSARFHDNVLNVSVREEHYVFLRNKRGNFIQQILGPAKPLVIANIGAEAIRVNTPLGKFLVPAGTALRLDQEAPLQRVNKKVLLTFSVDDNNNGWLKSALLLEGERWKPLNICHHEYRHTEIKDGAFVIQTLALGGLFHGDADLNDPPFGSEYEIYLRSTVEWFLLNFGGVCMGEEGLIQARQSLSMRQNEIYDLQRLRQAPTVVLMHQCTACLPGLEEVDGMSEAEQTEGEPKPLPGSTSSSIL